VAEIRAAIFGQSELQGGGVSRYEARERVLKREKAWSKTAIAFGIMFGGPLVLVIVLAFLAPS
jgi:hypothetical protein